ncbi:unnamed protein product, partial [Amoebophrya sp. A120]|eukprot:GSA120T00016931001.1
MRAVVGNQWSLRPKLYEQAKKLSFLPNDGNFFADDTIATAAVKDELKKDLKQEIDALSSAEDPNKWRQQILDQNVYYTTGKKLQKVATLCLMASKLLADEGKDYTDRCTTMLENAFGCLINPQVAETKQGTEQGQDHLCQKTS